MTEKFKESINKDNAFVALLTEAFDCIHHTLLIAKLFAIGVSHLSLKLIYSCLSNQTQQSKINKSFSDKTNTEFGVPQNSTLGPLLFNIEMNECEDYNVASYADNTTTNSCATHTASVALELQASSSKYFCWFQNNHLKANPGKSHILLIARKPEIVSIDEIPLTVNSHEKLLGVSELKLRITLQNYVLKLAKNVTISAVYQVAYH